MAGHFVFFSHYSAVYLFYLNYPYVIPLIDNEICWRRVMGVSGERCVLVIEDDPNTANLVALYLEKEGIKALQASDGVMGLALAKRHQPDLVVLDIMLPKMDGWEVCRRLRKTSEVPVIMLTARGEEIDRVSGLTLGADDYVVKPFSPRELVARVKAVLRRTCAVEETHPPILTQGAVRLDLDKRRLTVNGQSVELTPHEYALLEALMSSPGRTFTRDELLGRLYPQGEAVVIERVVDVHIGKLRQKIESNPSSPQYIYTMRGIGYRFADPSDIGAS
jgi:DNA-binding response OmpR family regulator